MRWTDLFMTLSTMCVWQQQASCSDKTSLTQEQRLHIYMSHRNRKQIRKDSVRRSQWRQTLNLISTQYPRILQHRMKPNHYIWDPPITKRLAFVFLHQPMAGDDILRKCLDLVAEKNNFTDSDEFSPNVRRKWEFIGNGTNYRSKFDLHQGEFAFGVCNDIENKQCAYLTMLREPHDRLHALFKYCQGTGRNRESRCHSASTMSLRDFLLHHGSTTFRQLVAGVSVCDKDDRDAPCWLKQKRWLDTIPEQHQRALLDYVLYRLEDWFSVIGLYEELSQSLELFSQAHRMPFTSCTVHKEKESDVDDNDDDDDDDDDVNDDDSENEVVNSVHSNNSDLLSSELDKLKRDPRVNQALLPDILIYRQATKIFRRQRQMMRNLL